MLAPQLAIAIKLGTQALRFLADLALLAFPAIVEAAPSRRSDRWIAAPPALATALLALLLTAGYPETDRWRRIGLGPGENLALADIHALAERHLTGVIYAEIADGGPIILELAPAVRPVMDARLDLYGPRLFDAWERAEQDPDALAIYLDENHVDLVLLDPAFHAATFERLRASPGWKLEFAHPARFLFSRVR